MVDTLALLIAHLNGVLPVSVVSHVPDPRPDSFLQVRRIGGRGLPPVREIISFDLFAWAVSSPVGFELIDAAVTAIDGLNGNDRLGVTVYDVAHRLRPRQADDPATGASRWWATVDFTVRNESIIHPASNS